MRGIILAGGAGTPLHPMTQVNLQIAAPGLRQADDLLSSDDPHVGNSETFGVSVQFKPIWPMTDNGL